MFFILEVSQSSKHFSSVYPLIFLCFQKIDLWKYFWKLKLIFCVEFGVLKKHSLEKLTRFTK